ncbi:unnamed protein product, partial [Rotaria sp. Silwood2]
IVEWEHAMRPLDSVQQAIVAKKSIVEPSQRYDKIMEIIRNRNFNADRYLPVLNIHVKAEEMLKIRARILPLPQITYRGQNNQDIVEYVTFGKWIIRNQFCSTSVINKWDMIYFGTKPDANIIEILKISEQQLPSITHTTSSKKISSIAAILGSCDPSCSRYAARLCEQYPKKDRCSIEIIKEMDKMIIDLLKVYARSCGNTLPNRIVFYRDGVDDGQFQKVLDNEVNKIKTACQVVYGNNPLPKLTFIIVKKRHNTRFFAYDGQNTSNIEAGTVVDLDITNPSQFDFYLCSQAAIKGTSRPALYHVLHDENEFSSDDIQQLTYWLCHTDVRCSKSVSIPAPVHYAHLAAYASHAYEFDHSDDEILESENDKDQGELITLEDIKTKLIILNNDIQDTMWFV